jgi:CRISPR-associated protein Cmr3
VLLRDLGLSGPQQDYRAHVSIRPDVQTAEDGALFATTGLEFTDEGLERLAVAISVEHQDHLAPVPGTAPLGGERRLVRWHHSTQEFPACPPELIEKIIQAKACRVLLLTPASFSKGWLPEWLLTGDLTEHTGVIVRLSGAALGRWQVVSGWDLERSEAKPTRRLVPAGSVFFLKLAGTEQAIGDWVTRVWMQCVSDTANDRNDGFGLAVVGTWPDSFSNGEAK